MEETAEFPLVDKTDRSFRSGSTEPFRTQQSGSVLDKNTSRRGFLKAAAILGGLTFTGATVKRAKDVFSSESKQNTQAISEPSTPATPERSLLQIVETEQAHVDPIESSNTVLAEFMFGEDGEVRIQRTRAEERYAGLAQTLEQIDTGLSVCFSESAVLNLLTKRSNLRTEGHPDLPQLSDWDNEYVTLYDIQHPERFAMCVDAVNQMKPKISQLLEAIQQTRSDSFEGMTQEQAMEMITINPAFLYQLMLEETSGLTFRGDAPAIYQYRGEYVKNKSDEVLRGYLQTVNEITGLQYNAEDVPGSQAGAGDASGGAIGLQFMPDNAQEFMGYMQAVGEVGNVFNPMDGLKMAVLYFAFRDYKNGDFETTKNGFMAWNPKESEAINVAARGESYDEFIASKLEEQSNTV